MTSTPSGLVDKDRIIGSHEGTGRGSLVVAIGGLHGNEPSGVHACRRVLASIESRQPDFRGRFLALAGNLRAIERGSRYVDEDLNRIWLDDRISKNRSEGTPTSSEDAEHRALLAQLDRALLGVEGEVYFLDLHTTSAAGSPFSVLGDTLNNRRLAWNLPGAIVLGLEEHLDGTLLNYINNLGHTAVGFEGGHHAASSSVDAHEVAVWKTLIHAGCIERSDCPDLDRLTGVVMSRLKGIPRVVEIRRRHHIVADGSFVMEPGFENLGPVEKGQLLARDREGDIRAVEAGRVLMPLYQSQGTDGFFIVREVRSFWLGVASLMRRLRLYRILPFLPGVGLHPELEDTLIVDPRIARWFVIQIFHLLGYRKQRSEAGKLVLGRRRERPTAFRTQTRPRLR